MKCIATIAVLLLFSFPVFAVDTKITIIAVTTGGANAGNVTKNINYLKAHWPNNGGVTLKFVNGGVPFTLTTAIDTRDANTQLAAAMQRPNWNILRETNSADVMLLFTGEISDKCGHAIQRHWAISNNAPAQFMPNSSGLDLRGSNDSYFAIIATTNSDCPTEETAAHEFGHLFGGGHTKPLFEPIPIYLYPDSHATATVSSIFLGGMTGFIGTKTILAETMVSLCRNHVPPVSCAVIPSYSSSGGTNNQRAFTKTAKSVANYRTTPSNSGCVLQTPSNVLGSLVGVCLPFPVTQYLVNWQDACPSATSNYAVWFSQPDGAPYQLAGFSASTSTEIHVDGSSARIRIQACDGSQCSSLSASSFLAIDLCQ